MSDMLNNEPSQEILIRELSVYQWVSAWSVESWRIEFL